MTDGVIKAHSHSSSNRKEIGKSKQCGCFHCQQVFPAKEVTRFTGFYAQNAWCPKCGTDSVLADKAVKLDAAFLKQMHDYWFSSGKSGRHHAVLAKVT